MVDLGSLNLSALPLLPGLSPPGTPPPSLFLPFLPTPPLSFSPLPSLALPSPPSPSSLLSHGWGGCSTAPATTATPPLVQSEAAVITGVRAWWSRCLESLRFCGILSPAPWHTTCTGTIQ